MIYMINIWVSTRLINPSRGWHWLETFRFSNGDWALECQQISEYEAGVPTRIVRY